MGPLQTMFGYLYDQARDARVNALRAKLSAGDDGGPIILDGPPNAPIEYMDPLSVERSPWNYQPRPNLGYRDPSQMGPSPPTINQLAAMLPRANGVPSR